MKGYKAFEKGMICRGKQYAENTVFEEEEAEICKKGMHFCKNPLDVLDYYPLVDENGNISEFAEVEALDEAKTDDGKKFVTKKLKVKDKITFDKLIEIDIKKLEPTDCKKICTDINYAKIGSSGDDAKISSSGKHAVICCTGKNGKVKGKKGSWITLAEWTYRNQEKSYVPVCVKTEYIDGERIKEDTFYSIKNGEFVECSEE